MWNKCFQTKRRVFGDCRSLDVKRCAERLLQGSREGSFRCQRAWVSHRNRLRVASRTRQKNRQACALINLLSRSFLPGFQAFWIAQRLLLSFYFGSRQVEAMSHPIDHAEHCKHREHDEKSTNQAANNLAVKQVEGDVADKYAADPLAPLGGTDGGEIAKHADSG
jgi:hypothetical protein